MQALQYKVRLDGSPCSSTAFKSHGVAKRQRVVLPDVSTGTIALIARCGGGSRGASRSAREKAQAYR